MGSRVLRIQAFLLAREWNPIDTGSGDFHDGAERGEGVDRFALAHHAAADVTERPQADDESRPSSQS